MGAIQFITQFGHAFFIRCLRKRVHAQQGCYQNGQRALQKRNGKTLSGLANMHDGLLENKKLKIEQSRWKCRGKNRFSKRHANSPCIFVKRICKKQKYLPAFLIHAMYNKKIEIKSLVIYLFCRRNMYESFFCPLPGMFFCFKGNSLEDGPAYNKAVFGGATLCKQGKMPVYPQTKKHNGVFTRYKLKIASCRQGANCPGSRKTISCRA